MTIIELVSIIRKRGQPTQYILMIDDEPITIQYRVPKTIQTQMLYTQHYIHNISTTVRDITDIINT